MAPPSSTSSSEGGSGAERGSSDESSSSDQRRKASSGLSLSAWPRVPRAVWAALLTVLLAGSGLGALAQRAPGQPPFPAYPRMATEVFRYAAATGRHRSEIVLLGSSLMRYGIQEDVLARELGNPDQLVINLAL